jgi:hypothetical protein
VSPAVRRLMQRGPPVTVLGIGVCPCIDEALRHSPMPPVCRPVERGCPLSVLRGIGCTVVEQALHSVHMAHLQSRRVGERVP